MSNKNVEEVDMIELMETMGGVKFSFWQKIYLRWMLRNNVRKYVKTIRQKENENEQSS